MGLISRVSSRTYRDRALFAAMNDHGVDQKFVRQIRSTTPLNVENFLEESQIWRKRYTGLYKKMSTAGDQIKRSLGTSIPSVDQEEVESRIEIIFKKVDNSVEDDDADITKIEIDDIGDRNNKTMNATFAQVYEFDQSIVGVKDALDRGIFKTLSRFTFISEDYLTRLLVKLTSSLYTGVKCLPVLLRQLILKKDTEYTTKKQELEETMFNMLLELEDITRHLMEVINHGVYKSDARVGSIKIRAVTTK